MQHAATQHGNADCIHAAVRRDVRRAALRPAGGAAPAARAPLANALLLPRECPAAPRWTSCKDLCRPWQPL